MSDSWRKAWLARTDEPVIEPDRPIVDPHHHLWHELRDLPRPYLAADLLEDLNSGHRIVQTVYVEAHEVGYLSAGPPELRPVGETAFVLDQAAQLEALGGPPIGGIVGYVDLLRGEAVAPVLDAHLAAGQGRFRGIRQGPSSDQNLSASSVEGGCFADLGFRAGVALLGRMGLIFEALVWHPQIPEVTALARACPDTAIILDHYGVPLGTGSYAEQRDDVFAQWQKDLAELAACSNVCVKLGGLAMPMTGFGWHERPDPPGSEELAAAQRPFFEQALAAFGPGRAMFESNFPVEKLSVSYKVLWNAFKRLASALSEPEKDALFRATAQRVYKLS
jgi:predicted TIM-barrel fold metal-dependent hydrolase